MTVMEPLRRGIAPTKLVRGFLGISRRKQGESSSFIRETDLTKVTKGLEHRTLCDRKLQL